MKLEFDSIDELEHFLMFSAHIGKVFMPAPEVSIATGDGLDVLAAMPVRDFRADAKGFDGDAFDGDLRAISGQPAYPDTGYVTEEQIQVMLQPMFTGSATEVPKRKRRTKAEVEADKARESGDAEHSQDTISTTNENGSSAMETAAATSVGANNPFAQPEATAQVAQNTAPRVVESIDHLRACQAFIQQHGMALYNESFRDGLNANIAAYTPDQRSQHVGILETLGK